MDLKDLRLNTEHGIHGATAGAMWQAVVFGFGGLRLTDQGITATPRPRRTGSGYASSCLSAASRASSCSRIRRHLRVIGEKDDMAQNPVWVLVAYFDRPASVSILRRVWARGVRAVGALWRGARQLLHAMATSLALGTRRYGSCGW